MQLHNVSVNRTQNDVMQYDTNTRSDLENYIALKRTRKLFLRDNLAALREMEDDAVDLVYLDPPFNSNRNYKIVFRGPEELRPMAHLPAFEDVWTWDETAEDLSRELLRGISGRLVTDAIQGLMTLLGRDRMMAYLVNMAPRLAEIRRVMRQTGTVYLHCDPTASHYLKVVMDAIFGRENFRNEIAWCYRGGGVPRSDFARKHDVILRYSKSDLYRFNPQFTEYSEASKTLVQSRGGVSIDDKERDLDRGAHMPDWWTDINSLQTWSPERTGYPTQKPVKLLERMINASSNRGDTVLDPFCGCGTSMVAAERLKRSWIGIDIEPMALNVLRQRFESERIELDFEVEGPPPPKASHADDWVAMAESDRLRFERAVIAQIANCTPWRNQQDVGLGIDAILTIPTDWGESRYVIIRVAGRDPSDATILRDLRRTLERGNDAGVAAGLLVYPNEPDHEVRNEARLTGEIEIGGQIYQRLGVSSLADVFDRINGKSPVLPNLARAD